MSPRGFTMPLVTMLCVVPLGLTVPSQAQDEDLGSLANKAFAAMEEEKWEEALALHTQVVARFGAANPLGLFGAQFGTIHFRKGICEMKLRRWDEAMRSFEICYRDFPNPNGQGSAGGNVSRMMSLLKWGEAAMGAEKWELAILQFRKFLEERDKERDRFPQGAFYVNMAVCHYQLGRIPEGNENLEIALKNKAVFPTPDAGIVAGFQSLVSAAIVTRNEQAMLDFIGKNRGELVAEPFVMHRYSRVFMKLAGDALGTDMPRAALAIYQLVPPTDAALDDIRARLKAMRGLNGVEDGGNLLFRKTLEADLAALETDRKNGSDPETVRLAAIAWLHEKSGNIRGACAAYQQLVSCDPASGGREENLFNLVRTSSLVETGVQTRRHAEKFMKTFPESARVPTVRRLMLSALFRDGGYESCIEIAEPMMGKIESGTPDHDLYLYILGGSYFQTGRYAKAQPLLDEHVETYPASPFANAAGDLRVSNMSRLPSGKPAGE